MIFELHSFWGNQNFLSNMWDHFTNAHALWENDSFPTVYRPVSRMPNGLNLACAPHGRLWGWCRSQMWVTPASQRENQKEIDRSIVTPMYQNVLPADTKHLFHASTLLIWYMGVGRISTRLPSALLSTPGPGWFALCFRMSTSGPWVFLGQCDLHHIFEWVLLGQSDLHYVLKWVLLEHEYICHICVNQFELEHHSCSRVFQTLLLKLEHSARLCIRSYRMLFLCLS